MATENNETECCDPPNFRKELKELINEHGMHIESGSTPFILADYLLSCLSAYNKASMLERKQADALIP